MNWKKRKKRNKIMKHYGYWTYVQYEMLLRFKNTVQHYKDKGWFSENDRLMIASHVVCMRYRDKWLKKNHFSAMDAEHHNAMEVPEK